MPEIGDPPMKALAGRTALEDAAREKVDRATRAQQALWYVALRDRDWTAVRALRVDREAPAMRSPGLGSAALLADPFGRHDGTRGTRTVAGPVMASRETNRHFWEEGQGWEARQLRHG